MNYEILLNRLRESKQSGGVKRKVTYESLLKRLREKKAPLPPVTPMMSMAPRAIQTPRDTRFAPWKRESETAKISAAREPSYYKKEEGLFDSMLSRLRKKKRTSKTDESIRERLFDIETARENIKRRKITDKKLEELGVTEDMITNPQKYISGDYEEPENNWGEFKEALQNFYYGTLKQGFNSTLEMIGKKLQHEIPGFEKLRKYGERAADEAYAEWIKKPELLRAIDMPTFEEQVEARDIDPRYVARTLGEAAPLVIGSIATALAVSVVASPAAGFIAGGSLMMTVEAGNKYRELVDKGVSPDDATDAASIYGMVVTVLENALGIKPVKVGARIGASILNKSQKVAIKKSVLSFLDKSIKTIVKGVKVASLEGGEEGAQEYASNVVNKYFDSEQKLLEGIVESIGAGLTVGAFLFPLGLGGSSRRTPNIETEESRQPYYDEDNQLHLFNPDAKVAEPLEKPIGDILEVGRTEEEILYIQQIKKWKEEGKSEEFFRKEYEKEFDTEIAVDEAPTFSKSDLLEKEFTGGEIDIEEQAEDIKDLTLTTLKKLEGRTKVSKQFISDLTNAGDIKQVERDLIRQILKEFPEGKVNVKDFTDRVKVELLPLEVSTKLDSKWENITLPDELRGDIANYSEHIYESPIETYAGEFHFPEDTKNYFAHTRVEDLANISPQDAVDRAIATPGEVQPDIVSNTRRIIEIQSDFFQKGGVESLLESNEIEFLDDNDSKRWNDILKKQAAIARAAGPLNEEQATIAYKQSANPFGMDPRALSRALYSTKTGKRVARTWDNAELDNLEKELIKLEKKGEELKKASIAKLESYGGIAWLNRIIKEEIKLAAVATKKKLQFPTGKTIMQIQGLGGLYDRGWWRIFKSPESSLSHHARDDVAKDLSNVKIGDVIFNRGDENTSWVITEILEDGKFKAIPEKTADKIKLVTDLDFDIVKIKEKGMVGEAKRLGDDDWIAQGGRLATDIYYEIVGFVKKPTVKLLGKGEYVPSIKHVKKWVEFQKRWEENFDVSGEVDTSNPIYKRYEKDIQNILKRLKPEMKMVTDAQGVTWWEIPITKEDATQPMTAFLEETKVAKPWRKRVIMDTAIVKELVAHLKRLGLKGVRIEFVKAIWNSKSGKRIFGSYFDGKITLASILSEFTHTHELGHLVFEQMEDIPLFKGISKNAIYRELRAKHPELKTKRELNEALQRRGEELAYQYKKHGKAIFNKTKVDTFWKRIFESLKAIFNVSKEGQIDKFWETLLTKEAKETTVIKKRGIKPANADDYKIFYDEDSNPPDDFNEWVAEEHARHIEETKSDTNQLTQDDLEWFKNKSMEKSYGQEEGEHFGSENLEEQYEDFKKLRIPTKTLLRLEDLDTFKDTAIYKNYVQKIGMEPGFFYSQELTGDEVWQMFRDRIVREREGPLTEEDKIRFREIKKLLKARTIKTAIEDISPKLKEKIKAYIRPGKSKNSRAFGLLGNKDTTIPLFQNMYENWVNMGVESIVEPYAGAFTLGTHSLNNAMVSGLKEYHANIFDKDKYIIVKAIKNKKVSEVKKLYKNTVKDLEAEIFKAAKEDTMVNKFLLKFKKKYPDNFIGDNLFKEWTKKEKLGAEVTVYIDYRKRFAKVFQQAFNKIADIEIKDLKDAVKVSFIHRIGQRATKVQKLVNNFGFQSYENLIFDTFGALTAMDDIANTFKLAEENNTKIKLYNMDGVEMINKIQKGKIPSEKIGYYLDPPYISTAAATYREQIKQQEKGTEFIQKFADPQEFINAHKSIIDSDSKKAFTNDINEDYLWGMLDVDKNFKLFAYKEGMTPTSLVVDSKTSETTNDYFTSAAAQDNVLLTYDYVLNKLKKQGSVDINIKALKDKGVPDELIKEVGDALSKEIVDERGTFKKLQDLIKMKVNTIDGEKYISAVINKKTLNYIKNTSNVKDLKPRWVKELSFESAERTVTSVLEGYETGARFFTRLGKGFKQVVFDPIRIAERTAADIALKEMQKLRKVFFGSSFLKIGGLNKKETESLFYYSAYKQGRMTENEYYNETKIKPKKEGPTLGDLSKNTQRAYYALRKLTDKYLPKVKMVGKMHGKDVKKVKNYLPMFTKTDLRILEGGGLTGWTRHDPFFGSTIERAADVPFTAYEKNMKKVMENWIYGVTNYVEVGSRTVPIGYLINSTQFKELSGHSYNKIREWFTHITTPKPPTKAERFVKNVRQIKVFTILSLTVGVVVKQLINTYSFMVTAGIGNVFKAVARKSVDAFYKGEQKSLITRLANEAGSVNERTLGYDIQDLKSTIMKWMTQPALWTDRLTAKLGYIAILERELQRAKKAGITVDARTFKRMQFVADNIVDGIMGGMAKSEQPKYFRSELGKNVNTFFSQVNSQTQFYVTDIWRKEVSKDIRADQNKIFFLTKAMAALFMIGYTEEIINRLDWGFGWDEEEDEADWEKIFKETTKNIVGNVPIMGSLIYALETGKPFTPAPVYASLLKIILNLSRGKFGDAAWEGTGFIYMPNAVQNVIKGTKIIKEGGVYDKTGRLMYRVEGTPEQIRTLLKGKYGSKTARDYWEEKKPKPKTKAEKRKEKAKAERVKKIEKIRGASRRRTGGSTKAERKKKIERMRKL